MYYVLLLQYVFPLLNLKYDETRMGLEFLVWTINKSAYTKKVWKLIEGTSYLIYVCIAFVWLLLLLEGFLLFFC